MNWLGIDIGGAHLKLAAADGRSLAEPFSMWRYPDQLASLIARLVEQLDPARAMGLAVTMTGELADCFEDKAAGVKHIAESAGQAAAGRPVMIYAVGGEWLPIRRAIDEPIRVAASNWHALAQLAVRDVSRWPAWLIDIGSTTTDVIPLSDQGPLAHGETDWTRLVAGELIYTGVERTPVCAVVDRFRLGPAGDSSERQASMRLDGQTIEVGLAAELFATMQDVYVTLGDLGEDVACCETADGRPRTRPHAFRRLRRLLCADQTEVTDSMILQLAQQAADRQSQQVADVMAKLSLSRGLPRQLVFSGHGEFLARRALTRLGWTSELRRLGDRWPAQLLRTATAYSVARLADEQLLGEERLAAADSIGLRAAGGRRVD